LLWLSAVLTNKVMSTIRLFSVVGMRIGLITPSSHDLAIDFVGAVTTDNLDRELPCFRPPYDSHASPGWTRPCKRQHQLRLLLEQIKQLGCPCRWKSSTTSRFRSPTRPPRLDRLELTIHNGFPQAAPSPQGVYFVF
jgi:hypothetical protein